MSITGPTPPNRFKQRLATGEQQIGLWTVLANGYTAEILAGCGYDWLLIDAEHGPNDLRSVLEQLQGIAAAATVLGGRAAELSQPVVRLPHGDPALIKQYLEIGVRNLLVPMVDTAQQAAELVRAVRYPPRGQRGMGSGLGRSSRWGRWTDYVLTSDDNVCLLVQVETRTALDNIEAIAATDGVDGVLLGPADLAADMGYPEQRTHPEVIAAIDRGVETLRRIGTPAGIMLTDIAAAQEWLRRGVAFAGVGVDSTLLIRAADDLLTRFRQQTPAAEAVGTY
ncbi:HpcH/HpaI aldolase family protein [Nocardia carnea]|uniref:HpcH/HpaI aldolase/citrate lyase family protein n=1 Tax=Nocardia carnea TaxID=37328 RepID=A0ABW7TDK2_9NOCA|nr:HpcH/HpaI aldolase/citrate lyase family protein [Nocardia carnea]